MEKYQVELSNLIKNNLYITNEYKFYALFIAELNREFTDKDSYVPTAALVTNDKYNLFNLCFNINFWDSLTKEEQSFLLIHELKHYTNKHYLDCKLLNWDKKIANYAQDLYINHETLDEIKNNSQLKLSIPNGGYVVGSFPGLKLLPSQTSKYYYDELIKAKDKKEQTGTSGDSNFDKVLDEDIHPTWNDLIKDLSDLEIKSLEKSVQMQLNRVANETKKENGNVPVSIKQYLETLNKIETIPWQQLFKKFVGSTYDTSVKNTRSRENRRFESNPGYKYNTKISIAFAYDSSGSVNDSELQECLAELNIVHKKGGSVYYAAWDSFCDDFKKYDGKLNKLERTKAGGTDLNEAILESNNYYKRLKLSLLVITTDGHIPPIIVKSAIPVLILITKDGNLNFENKFNYKVISMK